MTRRLAAAWLALVLGMGTASAESFAERLRARMKPKPQAQCQAKVEAALRRKQLAMSSVSKEASNWSWRYLFPEEPEQGKGNVVDCDGAEEIDQILRVKNEYAEYQGNEPPALNLRMDDPVQLHQESIIRRYNRMVFGARIQGKRWPDARVEIGIMNAYYKSSRGYVGTDKIMGVFKRKFDGMHRLPEMHSEVKPTIKRWWGGHPVRTNAPWVKTRLDGGELYFGQFFQGQPHGWGYLFSDGAYAGRMGFFSEGKPHTFQVEWRSRFVDAKPEGGGAAVPACTDYVRRVEYDHGSERDSRWVRRGAIPGYELVGIPTSEADHSPEERAVFAKRKEYKEQVERQKRFDKLRPGDVLVGGRVITLKGGNGASTAQTLVDGDLIYSTGVFELAKPGQPLSIKGFGRFDWSAGAKAKLAARVDAKVREIEAEARRIAQENARIEADRKRYQEESLARAQARTAMGAKYNRPHVWTTPQPVYVRPSASSSYSGPSIGSSAWHQHRALVTHPQTYYQNKY